MMDTNPAKNEIKFYEDESKKRQYNESRPPTNTINFGNVYTTPSLANVCKTCGIAFTDSQGRLISMGYVCSHIKCPSKVT